MDMAFFAEMAWKSALISGAALMLAMMLRSRAAADRAMVLRIGVVMLLALPLIVSFLPAFEIVAFAAPAAPPAYLTAADLAALSALPPAPEPTIWDDPTPLILLAYLGGVAMAGSRLLAGLWMLRRWTRGAVEVTDPDWLAAFERVRWAADKPDAIRLLAADGVKSPLSWGWRRPVILIDPDLIADAEDAEAILAHEVAHIARGDWPMLMLSRVAAVLFWFNPLVWVLEREIVQQAEEAADLAAAERMDPARYAETLLAQARFNGLVPAHSIAPVGGALGRRVRAVLDRQTRERPAGSALTGLAMLACLGVAAPVAAARLVAAVQPAPVPPVAPTIQVAQPAIAAPRAPRAPDAPEPPLAPQAPLGPDLGPEIGHAVAAAMASADTAMAAADVTLAEVMPRLPHIMAAASVAVDSQELREALREAERERREALHEVHRELARERSRMNDERRAEVARALRDANLAVARARPRIDAAAREGRRAAVVARRPHLAGMARGADDMARGAAQMEQGADQMERTARRLRSDPAYREEQIARAQARGETVTHEELIRAADGMESGVRGMRDGARSMRQSAERMRRGN